MEDPKRYRIPHLAKRHVRHIVYLEDDVIIGIQVRQVLAGRHFLGYPGNIALDYERRRSEIHTRFETYPKSNCPNYHRNPSHQRKTTPSSRE